MDLGKLYKKGKLKVGQLCKSQLLKHEYYRVKAIKDNFVILARQYKVKGSCARPRIVYTRALANFEIVE